MKSYNANGSFNADEEIEPVSVVVVGTGYVGLVAGACFASVGNTVVCVDVNEERVELLKKGKIPFFEPGLEDVVASGIRTGCLSFTTDFASAASNAQVAFVTVGTPSREDGSADLSTVFDVAETVANEANHLQAIVLKSTVPAGTTAAVKKHLAENTVNPPPVVVNPEFLREGTAVSDFLYPDRVVIGSDDQDAIDILCQLYTSVIGDRPIFVMDSSSAEMVKYVSNCFLATKLSFINEMANVCDAVNADIDVVRRVVGMDPRIGGSYLAPGIGYGGSCLPKDLRAMENIANANGVQMEVLKAVQKVNSKQSDRLVDKILNHFDGDVNGRRLTVWGLSFKPETDDIREAPSLSLISRFLELGANVSAYDPEASANTFEVFGNSVNFCDDKYDALLASDALIVATEWEEFCSAQPATISKLMAKPVIFDGRNMYDQETLQDHGITYYCMGRPTNAVIPSGVA